MGLMLPLSPPSAGHVWWLRWFPPLLAVVFLLLLWPKIDAGTLWHHDELLTANRAREMLVRGDPLAVTINFTPSVKKPPLQYWLCAGLLWLLPGHPELAVRLPTLLGGAACLLAVAALARTWFPDEGLTFAAWSTAAFCGCGYLIHFSRVGLLDTNAALLLTLFLVAHQQSRRDARRWWLAALFCVLGAWQKAPYGLAAWLVLLATRRLFNPADKDIPLVHRWRGHLPCAFGTAVLGSLGWWLIQWLRTDPALLLSSGQEQVGNFLRAHDPGDTGFRPWLYWAWLVRDWVLPGLCAPFAACAAVLIKPQRSPATQLGILCLVFGLILACLPYRAERYLVVITPLLTVLIVYALRCWSRPLPVSLRRLTLPLACASILPVACFQFFKPAPSNPDLRQIVRDLTRVQHGTEPIFVCTDADPNFEAADFVLFYANLVHPLTMLTGRNLASTSLPSSCCGVCSSSQWLAVSRTNSELRLAASRGNWILWTR